jgi:hypothetical protein
MLIKYYDIIIISKTYKNVQDMNVCARVVVLSFTSLIILASQIPLSFASYSSTQTVAASGTIVYPYIKSTTILKHIVVYPYTITDADAAFIASHFDLVDFDWDATAGFQKIKAANPNIIMIGYRDFMWMPTWYSDWSTVNQNESWFLHDIRGNRITSSAASDAYAMNISSAGWRNYIANWCTSKLAANPTIDGIFADDVGEAIIFSPYWINPFNVPLTDIPGDIITNWNTYMAGMIQTVKTALGSKLLIINTPDLNGFLMQYCDGQMIEHFLHCSYKAANDFSQTDPIGEMSLLEQLSATGKIVMAHCEALVPQNPTAADIELVHKCAVYCLSGYLLSFSGKSTFGFGCLHQDYTGHQCYWDEMDAPIGDPTGVRYNVQGDLWARDFTTGKVFLNVGDANTYTVNVAGKNYSVAPRSGLIVPT